MDVFSQVVDAHREYFAACVIEAAYALGVPAALADGPRTVEQLAASLGVGLRRFERLHAALDLVLGGRSVLDALPPRPAAIAPAGWGLLAEVLRTERPLDTEAHDPAYQESLARSGAPYATELVERSVLGRADSLLDLGGGLGTYSASFLRARPTATATLVDRPEVLDLAAPFLAEHTDRVTLWPADLLADDPAPRGAGFDVALLSNVLHLHGPNACATLIRRAAEAVHPGGHVVVKDLDSTHETGRWFALNMALYTESGDTWPIGTVGAWLEAAGLEPGPPTALSDPASYWIEAGKPARRRAE